MPWYMFIGRILMALLLVIVGVASGKFMDMGLLGHQGLILT